MKTEKRPRGRPKGTGRDDGPTLRAMAEMIAELTSLRPTTAIKRILRNPSDADVRRLQVKWRVSGATLLAQAKARRDEREEASRRQRAIAFRRRIRDEHEAMARMVAEVVGSHGSALNAARALYDNPAVRAAREIYNSPAARTARELHDSPAMRTAREIYNSPAARTARELYDSPAMRAVREIYDSPTARAARELHDRLAKRALRGRT